MSLTIPMLPDTDLVRVIQGMLTKTFLAEIESPETDLLKAGNLDSLTLVQFLLHLEEHFGLKLALDELEVEDFRSVRSIARLIPKPKPRRRADPEPETER